MVVLVITCLRCSLHENPHVQKVTTAVKKKLAASSPALDGRAELSPLASLGAGASTPAKQRARDIGAADRAAGDPAGSSHPSLPGVRESHGQKAQPEQPRTLLGMHGISDVPGDAAAMGHRRRPAAAATAAISTCGVREEGEDEEGRERQPAPRRAPASGAVAERVVPGGLVAVRSGSCPCGRLDPRQEVEAVVAVSLSAA